VRNKKEKKQIKKLKKIRKVLLNDNCGEIPTAMFGLGSTGHPSESDWD
jgi:hypothetical protein